MILKSSEQLVCPTTPAKGHHLRLGDGLRVRHVRLPHCYKRTKHGPSVPLANIPEVISDVTGECVLMQTGPDQHEVQTQVEPNTAHLQAPSFTHTHLLHCCCFPHTHMRARGIILILLVACKHRLHRLRSHLIFLTVYQPTGLHL